MTINIRQASNVTILDLVGPFVRGEPVGLFRDQVGELLHAGTKNFAINLAGVRNLDSSAVGALVGANTSIESAGAKFKLFGATDRVLQVLKQIRLDEVFELFPDEASAIADF